jgi:hypothetical protein
VFLPWDYSERKKLPPVALREEEEECKGSLRPAEIRTFLLKDYSDHVVLSVLLCILIWLQDSRGCSYHSSRIPSSLHHNILTKRYITYVNPTLFMKYSVLIILRTERHGNRGSNSGWSSRDLSLHYRILDSSVGIATGYGLDDRGVGVRVAVGSRIFSSPRLESTQPPIQWVPEALSPGVKRSGREADHSPPASAEDNKIWICTSTTP